MSSEGTPTKGGRGSPGSPRDTFRPPRGKANDLGRGAVGAVPKIIYVAPRLKHIYFEWGRQYWTFSSSRLNTKYDRDVLDDRDENVFCCLFLIDVRGALNLRGALGGRTPWTPRGRPIHIGQLRHPGNPRKPGRLRHLDNYSKTRPSAFFFRRAR